MYDVVSLERLFSSAGFWSRDLSNSAVSEPANQPAKLSDRLRRALVVEDQSSYGFSSTLEVIGCEIRSTNVEAALSVIKEFAPDIVFLEFRHPASAGENNLVALARRLRSAPATYALPVVLVFDIDEQATRKAALNIGVDDYFAISTPPDEVLARLQSLFWRIEAGRRAASATGDQRLEIDSFMFTMDSLREDIGTGNKGTLAFVNAIAHGGEQVLDKASRDYTLGEAQGFLKLNLRRIDAVAFYGPTTLFVYLPRMEADAAVAILSKLRAEFVHERPDCNIAIGLASFPENGTDVEVLIEKAETAANAAPSAVDRGRVLAFKLREARRTTPVVAPANGALGDVAAPKPATNSAPKQTIAAHPSVAPVDGGQAASAAADERARRAGGAIMPQRLLLTVSNAARMVQINSLIRSAGYEARAAFDGQQALDLLRIERPDLLVLDYDLNGIDGIETLRRFRRQNGGRLTLPVVMLMPSGSDEIRAEALQLGVKAVVGTPYDPVEFLTSVRLAGNGD